MKYFKIFLRDQRGVSPVIGVILMVAITVVMGAVVAGFVYGYLGDAPEAPNVVLSVIDDPNTTGTQLIIKHNGGEDVAANDWKCSITANKESATDFTYQTDTGAHAITTGTTLIVNEDTRSGGVNLTAGWYHIIAVHVPSDAILLDTNVLLR